MVFTILIGCKGQQTELVWAKSLPGVGSQSSIRTAYLNNDNILDLVIGAGSNEYVQSDWGIIALDGATGSLIWKQEANDLVFGTAVFYDVNDDDIKDVFIGGRSNILQSLDGKTGDTIWTYHWERYHEHPILGYAKHNFYSAAMVPDLDQDGYNDLLVQNGGNPKIGPGIRQGRVPGVLMIVSSRNGTVIASDTMPDGMESYMSPLVFQQAGQSSPHIVFGSGGETFSGHLYLAKLEDLTDQRLDRARIIASDEGHGFIAPPSIVDINQDQYLDIVAISHGSKAIAISGRDLQELWQLKIADTECSNSFAIGYFTDDDVPDFFTFVSKGSWPNNTGSLQILIEGSNGEIVYRNQLGCTGFSSAVAYDLNYDGRSEALLSINEFDCSAGFSGDVQKITNKLIAIDFASDQWYVIDERPGFKNIFTTPWIGDIDNNGYLDIVYCQYYHRPPYITSFLGMDVRRISTDIRIRDKVIWGAYLGSKGNGIFDFEER